MLSATLLFYRLLVTHIRAREKNREFLEILLLSLTHKLGNFISSQIVNLNILQDKYSKSAVNRLLDEYEMINNDMDQLVRIIEGFKSGSIIEEDKINLKLLVDKLVSNIKTLEDKDIMVRITSRKCELRGISNEIEIALYLLIDNAIKYSGGHISIRLSNMNNVIVFVIRNDKLEEFSKGTGMGLGIVDKLCNRYRIVFRVKETDDHFTAALMVNRNLVNRIISSL